ncbi:MAG TPA: ATP-binding protein [Phenylobacterium sp.]|nr:ATP-binding protein [Phenylobacterium sp.]
MARFSLKGGLFGGKRAPKPEQTAEMTLLRPPAREQPRSAATSQLPRFNTTANDQLSARRGDRFSALRAKIRRAFTPSQPVADARMFAGRQAILRTIISSIEDQRLHLVLYGERGIGKTSLLHMLAQAAHEARYIVVYTSCGAASNFDETFRAAAAEIPLLFHRGFGPTTSEAEGGATLADLLPSTPLTPRQFSDLCTKLRGTRVLIMLDEFDRCDSATFRRNIAELIKNLSDRLGRVQLLLAGVAGDVSEIVEHIPSIRRNILALGLPRMNDQEVLQIVGHGERESGLAFEPAASKLVVSVAQGSPYIASLLGHHAALSAIENERTSVLTQDVAYAVDQAVEEFENRIAKLSHSQIDALMASGRAEDLALAGRAALSLNGAFSERDLVVSCEVDEARARSIMKLLRDNQLVRPADLPGIHGDAVSFVEEGLPTFFWISWTQKNLAGTLRTPRAAAGA